MSDLKEENRSQSPETGSDGSEDRPPDVSDEPRPSDFKEHDRENTATPNKQAGYASTSNLDVSEYNTKENVDEEPIPDDRNTFEQPHQLVREDLKSNDKLSFTPELLTECGKTSYRFSCPGPGVFQCALTGLVFVMSQKAELLYSTIQWDEDLLQSAGKMAAGLLFDIKCSEDAAIHQLHLPHCETMDAPLPDGLLSVVHITDDGMSILKPLQITDTHVVVRVPHLSAFGLVRDFFQRLLNKPVAGRVLLFLRQPNPETQKLHVLLLPRNIPLSEVSKQYQQSVNIQVPSTCKLIKDQSYTLHCPQAIKIQPKRADFYLEFGPDYDPTFEIRLPTDTEEMTLTVKDQGQMEVWEHDVDLIDSRSVSPPRNEPAEYRVPAEHVVPAEERLFSVREEFVTSVSDAVLNQLLDKLLGSGVINDEEMQSAKAKNRAEKARDVIDLARRKGSEASSILISAICELDHCLAKKLKFS